MMPRLTNIRYFVSSIMMACCVVALSPFMALAQTNTVPASREVTDTICAKPSFRQFDYWAGDWVVKDTAGKVIGTNRVTRDVGGCVLHEHWASGTGEIGESFTTYSPTEKKWHQLYVGSGGYIISMSGTFEGDRLVLVTAPHAGYANPNIQVVERWTWTPVDATHVRQLATISRDGGATWVKQFDGLYERQPVAGSR
jgi:hypothetical protein